MVYGLLMEPVRLVKIKVFAVGLLLISFIAVGGLLIWQETTPEKNVPAQNGRAICLYQNPLAMDAQEAFKLEEKRAESGPARASFILWMLGMPLAVLGGLALGLTIGGQRRFNNPPGRKQVQYIVVPPPQFEECSPAVPEKFSPATQRDSSNLVPVQRARTGGNCRMRFRPAEVSRRRENQRG
jgi:hypothetical protein